MSFASTGTAPTDQRVVIDYTNHRGECRLRTIRPVKLWFGATEFHPEPQWLLDAIDTELGEKRDFAMKNIHSWTAV